jgi:hypothetical protein
MGRWDVLTPASVGPGGSSRRVRALAERGRVQGPGRAEADLGPRAVTDVLLPGVIASVAPERSSAILYHRSWSQDGPLQGSPLNGSLNSSLNGSLRGEGSVVAGLGLFALVRRYVGVRPIDSSPVDGPPSSAHSGEIVEGGRFSRPCGPGTPWRAISENQLAATPPTPQFTTGKSCSDQCSPKRTAPSGGWIELSLVGQAANPTGARPAPPAPPRSPPPARHGRGLGR